MLYPSIYKFQEYQQNWENITYYCSIINVERKIPRFQIISVFLYISWNQYFWRVQCSYFLICPSVWVCLPSFVIKDRLYAFGRNTTVPPNVSWNYSKWILTGCTCCWSVPLLGMLILIIRFCQVLSLYSWYFSHCN